MFRIILYGIVSLIWMFLAGVEFGFIFTRWEEKRYYIILCVIYAICAITYFAANVLTIMQEVNV